VSKIERQRTHFNSIAERYNAGRQEANHRRVKSLIWRAAGRYLAPLAGRRIKMLEAMCGYAEGIEIARHELGLDCDYHGFDYSDVIVADLSRRLPQGRVWQADATTYRPEPDSYDLVLLIGGLHHVPDNAAAVVRNLAAGLKPGGMFVNFEPTSGNPLFQAIREWIYRRNEIFDEATERAFAVDELKGFFAAAGLEEVKTFFPGLIAYTLYYNPYAFPLLNIGSRKTVDFFFALDRLAMNSWIGRVLSFATVTIWRKND
jgi:SAM-dependent methyltransferase